MKYNGREYADDTMILRDYLALERTILARKRTFLAYLRTILSLFATGIGILSFFDRPWTTYIGIGVLVLTGIIIIFMLKDYFTT